jgi:hypothetical protein
MGLVVPMLIAPELTRVLVHVWTFALLVLLAVTLVLGLSIGLAFTFGVGLAFAFGVGFVLVSGVVSCFPGPRGCRTSSTRVGKNFTGGGSTPTECKSPIFRLDMDIQSEESLGRTGPEKRDAARREGDNYNRSLPGVRGTRLPA